MTTKRPISWFLTEQGRKFSFAVITGTGITLTTAKFAPHTFFIEKYKNFVQCYRNSQPVELSKELQIRYEKCMEKLNIPEFQRKLISPFNVFGYDLFHAGSKQSRFGSLVGIPVHFSYKSVDDLYKDDIQVNQKKVDWTSEAGQKLADSLLLPEKVQEFAICREILATQNIKAYLQATYPFASLFLAYNVSQAVNKKFNLYAAPVGVRGVLYMLTGLFSLGVYCFLTDYTEVSYETLIDKQLIETDPEFAECGVIFYDKILKRNQALRELMGKEGEKKYSKLGNENFGIRQLRIALVHRKQFFESMIKQSGDNGEVIETA